MFKIPAKTFSAVLIVSNLFFSVAFANSAQAYTSQYSQETAIMNVVQQSLPSVVSIYFSAHTSPEGCTLPTGTEEHIPLTEEQTPDQTTPPPVNQSSIQNQTCPPEAQRTSDHKLIGGGTGIIISHDGYILTNNHVVGFPNTDITVVLNDERSFDANLIAQDKAKDLAVIKINADNLPVLQFSHSSEARVGQTAIAIGNSLVQFPNTVTVGTITGLNRSLTARNQEIINGEYKQSPTEVSHFTHLIQTNAALNFGNSGGPLLDLNGRIIGIVIAMIPSAHNIGFALLPEETNDIYTTLQSKGINITPNFAEI